MKVNVICALIFVISLCFDICCSEVLAQESIGTDYRVKYGRLSLGGSRVSSDDYIVAEGIIGVITGVTIASTNYRMASILEEVVAAEEEFEVAGLTALTFPGGEEILQSTWHQDNDPYFYWQAPTEAIEVLGYSYSLDTPPDEEVDSTTTSYYFSTDSISDGSHTFYVKAKRSSGLWGEPAAFDIWVDTTAPAVNNFSPGLGNVIASDSPAIEARISDGASGVDGGAIEMRVNQARVEPEYDFESGLLSYAPSIPLSDGEITISLTTYDNVGNYGLPLNWSFIVDTSGPQGTILINNGDELTTTNLVTLSISAEDEVTDIAEMMLSNDGVFDSETWESYASLRRNWVLPAINGMRKVYARVRDEAGNISEAFFDEISLVIIAPDTYILSGPSGITESQEAQVSFRGSLEDCSFSYKFDNEDWSDWSSSFSLSKANLAEGNHYFMVKAAKDLNKDGIFQLDEVDPTPALRVWTVSFTGALKPPAQPEKPIKHWLEE